MLYCLLCYIKPFTHVFHLGHIYYASHFWTKLYEGVLVLKLETRHCFTKSFYIEAFAVNTYRRLFLF